MKISYAITVCNEFEEIQKLLSFLKENKRKQDEIVILFDQKNGDKKVIDYLVEFNKFPNIQTWRGFFDDNFSKWKNLLTSYCTGDFIFQIDADEVPNKFLIEWLPDILEKTPELDIMAVPRINTVEGLTEEHIKKWGWRLDGEWVNFPDWQMRIYRNNDKIKWVNKVHEVLEGFETYGSLPPEERYCLYHHKDIKRQEKQNAYYDTL